MNIKEIPFYSFNTIIVGSGAAGYKAALSLHKAGESSVAIVTEGRGMGTSRNTGSDKQTYYKLTTCGNVPDSVHQMAQTLFDGGAMDGDIALAEAAGSLRSFYQLVDIGVPFPYNDSGEFVGYKTDHDPLQRGTSAGPLTSKIMTDLLEETVLQRGIQQYSGYQAIKLIVDRRKEGAGAAVGILALNKRKCAIPQQRYAIFSATNIIWATGGEAGMYKSSVYPTSQTGGMGVVLEEGVQAKNLTESQFGIASIQYRWNLSGTFQQCIPRYVSTDAEGGDEQEFLEEFFTNPSDLLNAIFLKGYQWPFDSSKVANYGSSIIDLLVYQEQVLKNRRIFLDFTTNPAALLKDGHVDFANLQGEAKEYLTKSGGLQETPYKRLNHMNPEAIKVYANRNIDLSTEYLEVAVCVQHGNGGLSCDAHWQSNMRNLFAIGEVNGTHGVHRPGGSALNSGQVGGLRAAMFIRRHGTKPPVSHDQFLELFSNQVLEVVTNSEKVLDERSNKSELDVIGELEQLQTRMTAYASLIRSREGIEIAIEQNREQWNRITALDYSISAQQLKDLFKVRHLLISQYVHLCAILDYVKEVKYSRGSALVYNSEGTLPGDCFDEQFRNITKLTDLTRVQEIWYDALAENCTIAWRNVRPIPDPDVWFENVWRNYRDTQKAALKE